MDSDENWCFPSSEVISVGGAFVPIDILWDSARSAGYGATEFERRIPAPLSAGREEDCFVGVVDPDWEKTAAVAPGVRQVETVVAPPATSTKRQEKLAVCLFQ